MLDALQACTKRIFLVGDSHQQIYSFRYAVDAMRYLESDEECELSRSFRFGEPIARLASLLIQEIKKERNFHIDGNRKKRSAVMFSGDPVSVSRKGGTTAILARTNLGLLERAIQLYDSDVPFSFQKDVSPILRRILDVYYLDRGKSERRKIKDPFLRSFTSLSHLEEYGKAMNDLQLLQLVKIVRSYRDRMPSLIYDLRKQASSAEGTIILSTIHAAKGEEYEHVFIHEDIQRKFEEADQEPIDEEVNVMYVAMTRAIETLHLPPSIRTAINIPWGQLVSATPPQKRPTTAPTSSSTGESRKYSSSSRKCNFRIGERVKTHLGTGVVIEVSENNEKYLVQLDDQPFKLLEKAYELRSIEE